MLQAIAGKTRNSSAAEHNTGPYVLRELLDNVALSEDGQEKGLHVTCVDFWNGNLYVGSSGGEVLHYVLIPAGDQPEEHSQFILATRLQLSPTDHSGNGAGQVGVQQILLLPSTDKACVVCNGNLTFYSLPELSPLFTSTKLSNCLWVGGLDQDEEEGDRRSGSDVTIMVCQKSRIRLVKIGDRLRGVREIEIKGCSAIVRRGNIACIADSSSYSLLDVVEKQRIPLFDLSSPIEDTIDDPTSTPPGVTSELITPFGLSQQQEADTGASGTKEAPPDPQNTEVDAVHQSDSTQSPDHPSEDGLPPRQPSPQTEAPIVITQEEAPHDTSDQYSSSNVTQEAHLSTSRLKSIKRKVPVRPHIMSPNPNEFLLTTGTSMDDPGVGIFVNLDGDVVRGTLEFSQYPEALCIDNERNATHSFDGIKPSSGGDFVLAVTNKWIDGKPIRSLEIQKLASEPTESGTAKHWLTIEEKVDHDRGIERPPLFNQMGMRLSASPCQVLDSEVSRLLVLKRLVLEELPAEHALCSTENNAAQLNDRGRSEAQFVNRLSNVEARIILWADDCIWWAVRNATVVRLDAQLSSASISLEKSMNDQINRKLIETTIKEVENREAQTELDFLGFRYIRQRASLLLFTDAIIKNLSGLATNEYDQTTTEEALTDGEIDPRLVLAILPGLRNEVVQGKDGIWTQNGLKELIEDFVRSHALPRDASPQSVLGDDILHLVKRYLQNWRRKKGFGSIADEREVFETVDAALLHVMLVLDQSSPIGPVSKGTRSTRAEMYAVVDHGVDCFDRAVELLETFQRLYVLSRLYQSRKMSNRVLATWRRIIEGEHDAGGELVDGEQEVGRYLSKISDIGLVEEYGTWLASRNPKLGIRIFTDNNTKVKIPPSRTVEILKVRAPNVVQEFLEHLVFDKNLTTYTNDLINYYLDSVISELQSSEPARSFILATYTSYRALRSPKPPYSHFATDNAIDAMWYRNRLRLLQLLGGRHGAASHYDIPGILARIEPFEEELVPEMIALSGRQGKHKEAIRLLTHGLGDFDTAVSYCVLGGSSTYSPLSGIMSKDFSPSREEQMSLFQYLLEEFLRIEDSDDMVIQTSGLLERFATWFDVSHVLTLIPESWSLDLLSNFLQSALRQLVTERNETVISRALTSVENLATSANLIEKIESFGPRVEYGTGTQETT